jgi:hypothetical protein
VIEDDEIDGDVPTDIDMGPRFVKDFMRDRSVGAAYRMVGELAPHFIPPKSSTLQDVVDAWVPYMRDWSVHEAMEVASLIIRTRKTPWFPTLGQVHDYRKSVADASDRGRSWAVRHLEEAHRLELPPAAVDWIIDALTKAYCAGAATASGLPPEVVERLGKHLIASAREVRQ